ncbi:radical SAM family heme chaperone HemW [Bacteriovorax sp. DB6_IX]|uniref:radical SAM family heme chaperone HemW n=1 Tax=Bacteriovorax sp. DB6_IX TaxID=1353530 RepID=UPI00038A4B09|nr:radical SAM family heme chaperone HemW [Bacteriovorax sp. DB6_IX]EQC49734.1 putative coproporphyrinogen dehydrogenase [Bacteriovorax sp. DB6_IX]
MQAKLAVKSLYLHYPFCRHLCNYCDFYKNIPKNDGDVDSFELLLEQMFEEHEKLMQKLGYSWQELETLYIGGGTPSLWGKRGAKKLAELFKKYDIRLSQNVEFTLEVNPGSWSEESLQAWQSIGVNRFSLGIQSLSSNFIKVLDRIHNIDDVYKTLEKFSEMKANFSVDFMLGLPFSKKYQRDILSELEEILKYSPNHISLYILTVKDHYIHINELPDDEWIEKEYLTVANYLKSKGFEHYEVSNFAKPGFESHHNKEYWKMNSVAAIGPSATGLFTEKGHRYKWKVSKAEYVSEELSQKELFLEEVYMGLRINDGLTLNMFNNSSFSQIAQTWVNRNIAEIKEDRVILNSAGFLILDSLMDELFLKLPNNF